MDYLDSSLKDFNRVQVKVVSDPYEACKDAHAIAILTEWDEFKNYDWEKIYEKMKKPAFVFDGRSILNIEKMKSIGFQIYSIGKTN